MLPLLLLLQVVAPRHDALRYDITLVPSDTGTHLLGEVETAWRLASADPVAVQLDSSMRVVRVLIDGRPNTRLSRTMYGRSKDDLVVPHQKRAGDSITTRVRFHGLAHVGARVGANARGQRIFVATGERNGARFWLPVPLETRFDRAVAWFRVQAPVAQRVIAPGVLETIDTLPYGDAVSRYRMDAPAPLASLAVASGPYQVRPLTPGRCGDGCPRVEVWSYAGAGGESGALGQAWEMVEFLSERAGRYPYGRLAHVEAAVAAAVAAPGMVLHPEGSLAGDGPADSTIALATARQWFGLAISPAGPEDQWVTTGLARLLAAQWRDRSARGRTTAAVDSTSEGGRAAVAMDRLRRLTGDSAFFAGIRRFASERLDQTATRADFVRAMSGATGRDIDRDLQRIFDAPRPSGE